MTACCGSLPPPGRQIAAGHYDPAITHVDRGAPASTSRCRRADQGRELAVELPVVETSADDMSAKPTASTGRSPSGCCSISPGSIPAGSAAAWSTEQLPREHPPVGQVHQLGPSMAVARSRRLPSIRQASSGGGRRGRSRRAAARSMLRPLPAPARSRRQRPASGRCGARARRRAGGEPLADHPADEEFGEHGPSVRLPAFTTTGAQDALSDLAHGAPQSSPALSCATTTRVTTWRWKARPQVCSVGEQRQPTKT